MQVNDTMAVAIGTVAAFLLLVPLIVFSWRVVARAWRYQGSDVSDILPNAGFSDRDKLGYVRAAFSATLMATLMWLLLGGVILNTLIPSTDAGGSLGAVLIVVVTLMVLAAFLAASTFHLGWPRALVPPAFRDCSRSKH
jgi:hypothetical protein